jgi:prevent-host-death family protein
MLGDQQVSSEEVEYEPNDSSGVDMKTLPTDYARTHMRDLLDDAVAGHPVVLTRYGKAVAVVVPVSFLQIGHDIPADSTQTEPS